MKRGKFVVPRFVGPGHAQVPKPSNDPDAAKPAPTTTDGKENDSTSHHLPGAKLPEPTVGAQHGQDTVTGIRKSGQGAAQPQQQAVTKPAAKPSFRQLVQPAGVKPAVNKVAPGSTSGDGDAAAEYFQVLYIKKESFVKKKLAKAYADGILSLVPTGSCLHALDTGKVVTSGKARRVTMKELMGGFASKPKPKGNNNKKKQKNLGSDEDEEDADADDEDIVQYQLGTFVIEVQQPIPPDSFKSGACFTAAPVVYGVQAAAGTTQLSGPGKGAGFKPVVKPKAGGSSEGLADRAATASRPAAARGLYDPHQPGAILLNAAAWQAAPSKVAPVVVDPYLGRHLRPHQVEGVRFMYECVMGVREAGHSGCVLADEMGLGKTLQVLTLCWTLLKQGPAGKPVASKVIVITPATLCGNWLKEVNTWLGRERLQVFMLGSQPDAKVQVQQFKHGAVDKMCITSYETLRKHAGDLAGTFDLLVCDEGHRLKAVGGSKTLAALNQLACPRRVLLTGTPIQNNLEEFYALVSFVAPDLLGAASAFRRVYAEPIAKAQERDAATEVQELGASRAGELNRKVAGVLLRRTQAILTKHLPPLTNYVLFCRPTPLQVTLYEHIIKRVLPGMSAGGFGRGGGGGGGGGGQEEPLAAITALKKACNHPSLLSVKDSGGDDDEEEDQQQQGGARAGAGAGVKAAVAGAGGKAGGAGAGTSKAAGAGAGAGASKAGASVWVPACVDLDADNAEASGKMAVLCLLLGAIISAGERVVVVSTSTATLDAVMRLCTAPTGLRTVRIDGSTSVDERQSIVDGFNARGVGQVFLLSTRAGGAGLNLIGANHLVLFDSDWNPAADLQAMARIWRDGQKRPCSVWRLLTTGTIEEKIYQRQIMKGNLASATIAKSDTGNRSKSSRQFTSEELRDLFVLNTKVDCETRDLLAQTRTQTHMRWLECGASSGEAGGRGGEAMPAALRAVLASGRVSAASAALKSEEEEAVDQGGEMEVDGSGDGGDTGDVNCGPSTDGMPMTHNQQQTGHEHALTTAATSASPGSSSLSPSMSPPSGSPAQRRTGVRKQSARGQVQGGGSTLDEGGSDGSGGAEQRPALKRSRRALLGSDSDEDVELPDV